MLIDGRAISARYFETRLGESEMREIFHVRVVLAAITIRRGRWILEFVARLIMIVIAPVILGRPNIAPPGCSR